jgi:hypothetical protein
VTQVFPSQGLNRHTKIVSKTALNLEANYWLNCSYTNKKHLQVLVENRVTKISDEAKADLATMDHRSQLMEVIHAHTPSEMRMVYM